MRGAQMIGNFQDTIEIKELLRKYPKGLNISEISNALHMHRNTSAKYLDMLKLKGDIDRKQIGTAKNYFLVQRMPVSPLISFTLHPVIVTDSRKEVVMVNKDTLSLFGCPLELFYGEKIENLPYAVFRTPEMENLCHDAIHGRYSVISIQTSIQNRQHDLYVQLIPVVFDTGRDGCAIVIIDKTEIREVKEELDSCRKKHDAVMRDRA